MQGFLAVQRCTASWKGFLPCLQDAVLHHSHCWQHRDVQLNAKVRNTCIVHVPDASVQHTSVLDSNIINISTSPTHHSQLALNDCMPQIIEVTTCVAAAVVLQRLCCQHCDTQDCLLALGNLADASDVALGDGATHTACNGMHGMHNRTSS